MNNLLYNNIIRSIKKSVYNAINENYQDSDLTDSKLHASKLISNAELKRIINSTDFVFMQDQIVKDNSYIIGGDYDLTWYKFTCNDVVLGLIAVCPMENMQHEYIEDADETLYIACVEISKDAKNVLGITDKIRDKKQTNTSYKTVLKNIIEFIEETYCFSYSKLRLSTESDSIKLRNIYETCGFNVIGRTLWDGYEMEKDM